MSQSEKWTENDKIIKCLNTIDDASCGSGPVLYAENGQEYTEGSDRHISVTGNTGMGKTQCITLPFAKNIAQKG